MLNYTQEYQKCRQGLFCSPHTTSIYTFGVIESTLDYGVHSVETLEKYRLLVFGMDWLVRDNFLVACEIYEVCVNSEVRQAGTLIVQWDCVYCFHGGWRISLLSKVTGPTLLGRLGVLVVRA
jgi:hypothetical protein